MPWKILSEFFVRHDDTPIVLDDPVAMNNHTIFQRILRKVSGIIFSTHTEEGNGMGIFNALKNVRNQWNEKLPAERFGIMMVTGLMLLGVGCHDSFWECSCVALK